MITKDLDPIPGIKPFMIMKRVLLGMRERRLRLGFWHDG